MEVGIKRGRERGGDEGSSKQRDIHTFIYYYLLTCKRTYIYPLALHID